MTPDLPTLPPSRPIFESALSQVRARLALIPDAKRGALVVAVDYVYGVPIARVGVATRIGDHWELGADAETRFSHATTRASVYAALTW